MRIMNWKNIIGEMIAAGETTYSIAEKVGVYQSSIHRIWKKGIEPKHALGQRIIALHKQVCGEQPTPKQSKQAAA